MTYASTGGLEAESSTTLLVGDALFAAGRAERCAEPPVTDWPGRAGTETAGPCRLGGFWILGYLGRGGAGEVYLAEQAALQRPVALKILRDSRAADPEYRARFVREAQIAARLVHPNAVQVFEAGERDGLLYMAMEYVDGQTLAELLASRGRIPWRSALEITWQAAAALEAAHEMGIVHRDIKPSNLLLSRRGLVKLTDFGLASLAGGAEITGPDDILGTPHYMSPEQSRGEPARCASDLYSLGVTAYHMLVGRPPFQGPSAVVVRRRHVVEPPRAPTELVRGVPRLVSDLVLRMLAKEPAARLACAGTLRDEINLLRNRLQSVPDGPAGERSPAPEEAAVAIGGRADSKEADRAAAARLVRLLSPAEMRELLAFEATWQCLMPRPRPAFLEATMRNYRIPQERMRPFLERPVLTREDVWELQTMKRAAVGDAGAVQAIRKLRTLERVIGPLLPRSARTSRR